MASTALGSANTVTGLTTPDLLQWIESNVNASGTSFVDSGVSPFFGKFGTPTIGTIKSQLKQSGYSTTNISDILTSAPSTLRKILDQIGQSAVLTPIDVPVAGVSVAAAGAGAEGVAGGTAGSSIGSKVVKGAKIATGVAAAGAVANAVTGNGILSALGSVSFWKGLGLVLGGVLILVFAAIEFKNIGGM